MDLFSELSAAEDPRARNYIRPGQYLLRVKRLYTKESQHPKSKGQGFVVAMFEVLSVLQRFPAGMGHPENGPSNEVGESVSVVSMVAKQPKSLSTIKSYVQALAGAVGSRLTAEHIAAIRDSQDQLATLATILHSGAGELARNLVVKCTATGISLSSGGPFTALEFEAVEQP